MQPEMPSSAKKMSSAKKRAKKDEEEEDKHSELLDDDLEDDDLDSPDRGDSPNMKMGSGQLLGKRLRQENGLVELTKKFI